MSSGAGPGAGRLTVVVADRHRLLAEALASALRERPELEVADILPQSGAHAVQATLDAEADVALLDLWLGGVTAIAAAATIAAVAPQVRVMVLGWRHDRSHARQALAAGAAGFVAKDVAVDELVAAIHRVADGERVVVDPDVGHVADAASWPQAGKGHRRPAPDEALTVRELEVLGLLGEGLLVEDIAERLGVTPKTAQTHIHHILGKTGTRSQLKAVAAARERGYLA